MKTKISTIHLLQSIGMYWLQKPYSKIQRLQYYHHPSEPKWYHAEQALPVFAKLGVVRYLRLQPEHSICDPFITRQIC
jgi:hypothetical protein